MRCMPSTKAIEWKRPRGRNAFPVPSRSNRGAMPTDTRTASWTHRMDHLTSSCER